MIIFYIYNGPRSCYALSMNNYLKLQQDSSPFWTIESIAVLLNISRESSRVLCTRYVKNGVLIRLKRNFYLLRDRVLRLNTLDLFHLSNFLQTPSYVSFMSALAYHEVTTQLPRTVIEAVNPLRTITLDADALSFVYRKITPHLYFGFERIDNVFVATKEKALLDCLYLQSLKKYSLDVNSLDLSRFPIPLLEKTAVRFPKNTQQLLNRLMR